MNEAATEPGSSLKGRVEKLAGRRLRGWVFDPEDPLKRLNVTIYVDNEAVGIFPADAFRPDLEKAGIGDGAHAFAAVLPSRFFDGQLHSVVVRETESGADIYNWPEIAFDGTLGPSCVGQFTRLANNRMEGFVYDLIDKETPIEVVVLSGETVLARSLANEAVPGNAASPPPPDGSGFSVDLAACDLNQLATDQIRIEAVPSGHRFETNNDVLRSVATLRPHDNGGFSQLNIAINQEIKVPIVLDVAADGAFVRTIAWRPGESRVLTVELIDPEGDIFDEVSVRLSGSTIEVTNSPMRYADIQRRFGRGFSRTRDLAKSGSGDWVGVVESATAGLRAFR